MMTSEVIKNIGERTELTEAPEEANREPEDKIGDFQALQGTLEHYLEETCD